MKKTTKLVIKTAAKYAARSAKKAAVKIAADAVKENTGLTSGRKRERFSDTIVMRDMRKRDREEVLEMMRAFYSSEAVLSNGSDEIFNRDINECISESPYAEGFVFELRLEDEKSSDTAAESIPDSDEASATDSFDNPDTPDEDNSDSDQKSPRKKLLGYAMIAHSFSTEYGKRCIWIEDLYLKEEARGLGLASAFLEFIRKEYPDALHRLEAENENGHAMEVYRHQGFSELPYVEMVRDKQEEK